MTASCRRCRFRFDVLPLNKCPRPRFRALALPEAVTLKRFFIPLCVFCFGIIFHFEFVERPETIRRAVSRERRRL